MLRSYLTILRACNAFALTFLLPSPPPPPPSALDMAGSVQRSAAACLLGFALTLTAAFPFLLFFFCYAILLPIYSFSIYDITMFCRGFCLALPAALRLGRCNAIWWRTTPL